jgi:hypothetical protein
MKNTGGNLEQDNGTIGRGLQEPLKRLDGRDWRVLTTSA